MTPKFLEDICGRGLRPRMNVFHVFYEWWGSPPAFYLPAGSMNRSHPEAGTKWVNGFSVHSPHLYQ